MIQFRLVMAQKLSYFQNSPIFLAFSYNFFSSSFSVFFFSASQANQFCSWIFLFCLTRNSMMQALQKMCPQSQHMGSMILLVQILQIQNFLIESWLILYYFVPYSPFSFCRQPQVNIGWEFECFECLLIIKGIYICICNVCIFKNMNQDEIQIIQQQQILKQVTQILSKNYSLAYSIMKAQFYSIPTQLQHKLHNMCQIITHYHNWTKQTFFNKLRNLKQESSYWKIKGILAMVLVLGSRVGRVHREALYTVGRYCQQREEVEGWRARLLVGMIVRNTRTNRKIVIYESFQRIRKYKTKNNDQLNKGALSLQLALNCIIKRKYREFLKHTLPTKQPHKYTLPTKQLHKHTLPIKQQQQQQQTTQTTKQMIKTMLICMNKAINTKNKYNSRDNYEQNVSVLVQCLDGIVFGRIKQGFDSMYLDYLAYFDEEMINKLETQIAVLKQQLEI